MTSPYRSPQSTHYGTQRSLEIEIRTDPTQDQLADLQPFVNEHSTSTPLPFDYETVRPPGPDHSQIVVRVAHASDASIVAVAVGSVGVASSDTAAGDSVEITHVVVRTSQRRRGYGKIAVVRLLSEARRYGCVLATAGRTRETTKATERLLRGAGFQRSEVFGFAQHLGLVESNGTKTKKTPLTESERECW
jgi:GNAT superfamily N-acetyltransferase